MRSDRRVRGLGVVLLLSSSTAFAQGETGGVEGVVKIARLKVGSKLRDYRRVLVYLEDAPNTGSLPRGPFQIEQSHKGFHPELLVVPKGATVAFPNADDFAHNVFSVSPANGFDLGLYETGTSKSVTFDHAGVVAIYCNVHPQMTAHVVVVTNAFFAHPNDDGAFAFKGIPAGSYHLSVWFPFGPPIRRQVKIDAGRTTPLRIDLREVRPALLHLDKQGQPYNGYSIAGRQRRANARRR